MGYYTNYSLEVEPPEMAIPIADKIRDNYPSAYSALGESLKGTDAMKWYDHERDMRSLSREFPNVFFDLFGSGEENGDQWHKYFVNGRMQECRAVTTFPPFDQSKLK